jgi:hypothetical protein
MTVGEINGLFVLKAFCGSLSWISVADSPLANDEPPPGPD